MSNDALLPEVRENDELVKRILAKLDVVDDDPEAAAIEITNRILLATSVDEVLAPRGAVHARDVIGEAFTILGVRWMRSDFPEGTAVYAVMEAKLTRTGEVVAVTCGARNVMAALLKLIELDALPIEVVLRESDKPSSRGFKPMWLEKPEEDF